MADQDSDAQSFPRSYFISVQVIDGKGMSGGDPPYNLKYSNRHFCWVFVREKPRWQPL